MFDAIDSADLLLVPLGDSHKTIDKLINEPLKLRGGSILLFPPGHFQTNHYVWPLSSNYFYIDKKLLKPHAVVQSKLFTYIL